MSRDSLPTMMAAFAEVLPRMAKDVQERMSLWPAVRHDVSERRFLNQGGPFRIDFEFGDFLREHNHVLLPMLSAGNASFSEIRWATERMERSLKRVLDTYDEVRVLQAGASIPDYWYLLEEIYCDLLAQIQVWLDELMRLIGDVTHDPEIANVSEERFRKVIISLQLARPPQMEELKEWVLPTASEVEVDLHGGNVSIRWGGNRD